MNASAFFSIAASSAGSPVLRGSAATDRTVVPATRTVAVRHSNVHALIGETPWWCEPGGMWAIGSRTSQPSLFDLGHAEELDLGRADGTVTGRTRSAPRLHTRYRR